MYQPFPWKGEGGVKDPGTAEAVPRRALDAQAH